MIILAETLEWVFWMYTSENINFRFYLLSIFLDDMLSKTMIKAKWSKNPNTMYTLTVSKDLRNSLKFCLSISDTKQTAESHDFDANFSKFLKYKKGGRTSLTENLVIRPSMIPNFILKINSFSYNNFSNLVIKSTVYNTEMLLWEYQFFWITCNWKN